MNETTPIVEAEFTLLKRNGPGAGMRTARRYKCMLGVLGKMIRPNLPDEEVWIHDLSKEGVGLNVDHAPEIGSPIALRVRIGSEKKVFRAIVVHATAQVDGTFRVGCRFDRKISAEDLEALL